MSSAPRLEMLWEASDPELTLQKFGFPDAGSAARWVAAIVGAGWGISVTQCERIVFSAGNALAWIATDRGPMIAKSSAYTEFHPHLEEASRLTSWLGDSSFPVSAPIPARSGGVRFRADGASIELQAVMEGSLLDAEDPAQAHMAGATLAQLHLLLEAYPHAGDVEGPPYHPRRDGTLRARIDTWLESEASGVPADLTALAARLSATAPDESPPTQVVHHDYRSANLLCNGAAMTAVLDFEEARPDHCVVDLAKASVLLGTRFRDWRPVSVGAREMFLEGYQSVRSLSDIEKGWLAVVILWWTLQGVVAGWWKPDAWLASARAQAERIA